MVLGQKIKTAYLGILILCPLFLPQTFAQGECKPHKRVVKALGELFHEYQLLAYNPEEGSPANQYLHPGDCIYRIDQQDEHRGYLLSTRAKGRYDYFDYSIVFSEEKSVLKVLVTVYRSPHGAAICQKKWLSQFEGYKGGGLELGADIDAVSGATLSAGSLVMDIRRSHLLLSSLNNE